MIARLWRTRVRPGREVDYEQFAVEHSLPMFRRLAGCLGVMQLRSATDRVVLSLWADDAAVAALPGTATYRETARRLEASGVLNGATTVEVFEIHGVDLYGIGTEGQ